MEEEDEEKESNTEKKYWKIKCCRLFTKEVIFLLFHFHIFPPSPSLSLPLPHKHLDNIGKKRKFL